MKTKQFFLTILMIVSLSATSFSQGFKSKDVTQYVDNGNKLSDKGEYAKAVEEYDLAIELSPNFTEAIYYRGIALFELGKLKSALADFNKAIDLSPNFTNVYKWRAKCYQELAKYTEAVEDWNRVINQNGGNYDEFYERGKSLLVLEQNELAIKDLLKARTEMSTNSNVHLYLGIAYSNLAKYKTAIEYYNQALDFDRSNHRIKFFRGKAKYHLGKYIEAIDDLSDYIDDGDNVSADAYHYRGLAHISLKETVSGIPDLAKAVQMAPTSTEFIVDLAWGYEVDKSYDEAIDWYSKALRFDNSNVDAYLGRGRSKLYLGDNPGACEDWGFAISFGYSDNDGMIKANCK